MATLKRAVFFGLSAFAATLSLGCSPSSSDSTQRMGSGGGGATSGGPSAAGAGASAGGSAGVNASANGGVAGSSGAGQGGNAGVTGGGATPGGATTGGSGAGGMATTDFCAQRTGQTFCETFEDQAAGPAQAKPPWAPSINGDGTLTIDSSVAHSGTHSLQVHGSGFSTFLVLTGNFLPVAAGPLHVRSYVRMAEAMTGGHNTLLVADLNAAPGTGNALRLGEMNAMLMYTVSGDTHGALANDNYYTDHLPGAALQPATWACLEVLLDHQKPEIQVWLDGKELPDLHHTDWPVDAYDALRFGFEKYAGPVSDIWYDDIAVGTAAIGCQ